MSSEKVVALEAFMLKLLGELEELEARVDHLERSRVKEIVFRETHQRGVG